MRSAARVRRPWSLAARLTAWYAGSAFALILVATSFLYWALAASLDQEDDATLARKVQILRAVLRDRPGDLAALRQEAAPGGEGGPHADVYLRLLDDDGRAAVETPGMAEILPPTVFPPPIGVAAEPGAGHAHRRDRHRPDVLSSSGCRRRGRRVVGQEAEVLLADAGRRVVV